MSRVSAEPSVPWDFRRLAVGSRQRIHRLISDVVMRLDLRLDGLRVLTESGSGPYASHAGNCVGCGC